MKHSNVVEIHPVAQEPQSAASDAENKAMARILVIRLRRSIRQLADWNKWEHDHIRYLKKEVKKLIDGGNVFDTARIKHLNMRIHYRESCCQTRSELMKKHAKLLMDSAPIIDACTTLAERCDLLNINVADRGDLTEEDGIVQLVYLHCLEDSATYRGKEDWDFDGPLNNAMRLVFMDFLINTPEGRAIGDSLFEPGGLLESLPVYKKAPDGTFVRQPPRLRIV